MSGDAPGRVFALRATFRSSNKLLRRARRLWVFLYCRNIRTHPQLSDAAKRMQANGLYATTVEKDVRFAILRKLWRISGHPDWHVWTSKNGWSFWKWRPWDRRDPRFIDPPKEREKIKLDIAYP